MAGIPISTLLIFGIPLFFFAVIGFIDLLQKFGYIQTEKQKENERRIKETHNFISNLKDLLENKDNIDLVKQVLSLVTQQVGFTAESRTDIEVVKGILGNVDMAVRKLDIQQFPKESSEQLDFIYKAIKFRSNERRVEEILKMVEQIYEIVSSHDKVIKELKELHPSARFDQGETPAHWCTARELTAVIGQVHNDIVEAIKKMSSSMEEIRNSVKGERVVEVDHLLKVVDLLGTLLRRIESLQDRYQGIYDLLTTEA